MKTNRAKRFNEIVQNSVGQLLNNATWLRFEFKTTSIHSTFIPIKYK